MNQFFRKIRQKFLSEGNTGKFFKYAIGEIILVVIGILIALEVNNLNDLRKSNLQENLLIESLITDLRMDMTMLERQLKSLREDSTQNIGLVQKMSDSNVTIETLKQIARYEFEPRLPVTFTFNDNTIQSLMSTGSLNIMDRWIQEDILTLNEIHKTYISRTNLNLTAYVNQLTAFARNYPLRDFGNLHPNSKLADAIWKKAQFEELGVSLNSIIAIRNVTNSYALDQINEILKKTKEVLNRLENLKE